MFGVDYQDIGFLSKMLEELESRNIATVTIGADTGMDSAARKPCLMLVSRLLLVIQLQLIESGLRT